MPIKISGAFLKKRYESSESVNGRAFRHISIVFNKRLGFVGSLTFKTPVFDFVLKLS